MDPNAIDQKGNTALIAASKEGHQDVVRLLLKNGADIEGKDTKFEGTPLIWAALGGQIQTAKQLLDKGADLNAT